MTPTPHSRTCRGYQRCVLQSEHCRDSKHWKESQFSRQIALPKTWLVDIRAIRSQLKRRDDNPFRYSKVLRKLTIPLRKFGHSGIKEQDTLTREENFEKVKTMVLAVNKIHSLGKGCSSGKSIGWRSWQRVIVDEPDMLRVRRNHTVFWYVILADSP
jgi:hypothetical protein